ncbi:hypothetical protein A3C20_03120 [Candidatus Kaiserbacteria bacterium RIFCSPHIGHO2_02_FULL_55_25]|uniref:Uncharacterized protein n=1 Tax=Candidatus Kaiserbacteria bacterium RIFCSPHIGHO2_02_FULL_55_25 TaxID=1798498 RepID=A0A1F6E6I7_9BACT|nr:MAG: hypothetical protein A2764_02860 [Candidatus Kaiserbacteria bacterium RIFCSPHIGHO2_01_FULL_55_79]OGG69256.1 MAG: hypothetical protein A3C20_03120 [Candidatus Kaiserbacteria bacterium RIFCSPHIGHO2_02_FULL_55_25]OGG83890.1 MAG: hypothetical protein A3A42_00125 [Candidatus Kaiserbacteria bacterium RIFCSPLOWO2_01_FULL_55_25]
MPPVYPTPPQNPAPPVTTMPKKKGGVGATAGIVIIVILMLFGALYFWGAYLNSKNQDQQLPLIPGDPATSQQ